jgi:hypothetical protein
MKSTPELAAAQYTAGSALALMVTLVIFSPRIIFALTGFQIGVFGGASNLGPYFQVFMLKGP